MHDKETPKANPENLLKIVQEAYEAKVVVPEFQRSFVWERNDIQELLTSILQGYFVGSFLMLDTPSSKPMFPFRTIEGLERVNSNVRPDQHNMVRLVLDGQQRITSIFYALYSPDIPLRWTKYPYKFYLLLEAALNGNLEEAVVGISVQDRRRMSEVQELVKNHRALPFTIFRESSTFYRWLYSEQQVWGDEARSIIEQLFRRIQNFMIPVVSLSPDAGTDNIVNIFERINRTGVSLSLFDLVVARLYPKGVRLRDLWDAFKNEHEAFADIISPEFLLKVIAILEGKEPRKGNLLEILDGLDAKKFEARWKGAEDAVCAACKRIEKQYGAYDKAWIPYTTMIVPLAVLLHRLKEMRAGEEAYRKVDRWYWASVFTQRYDSGVDTKSYQDVRDVISWITEGLEPDWLRRATAEAVDLSIAERRSAVYKGVICLILREGARDFLTGQQANLNTCQDDHIFPRGVYNETYPVDVVLNRTLISRETNNKKRDKHPSEFLEECLSGHNHDEARLLDTLRTHFITRDAYEALKQNDFEAFVKYREEALKKAIQTVLTGVVVMPNLGNERYFVQNPLIRYAVEIGWAYLPPEEALRLRRGESGIVLREVLIKQLQRLNPGIVDHIKAEEIIRRLISVYPNIEGNLQAWEYLNGLKTVFVEAEHRERNVRLLDPDTPELNTFHVTDEFYFTGGAKPIRADIVFFINGIPVVVVETKSATRIEGIAEALDQIRRYHQEAPELLAILQLHALTHLLKFYYGATWNTSRKSLYNWRDEQAGDFETLVKTFFAPRRILRVLTEFILFARKDGELSKVVLRPHQIRAAERVIKRARDPEKKRGLIWHTQGSGKTYTMITVAKRLLEDPVFNNPTVLMLVDRNELEQQLFGNLEAVGFARVQVANSKRHLYELLKSDYRGLIVSMIHKFDDIPANVNLRENIYVLVDEAHRTTGGKLGNYLMGALPNATYIGFTGTPIDKTAHGKGTFKVFGTDDPKGYLDKYSIRESIEDGTTVPLHYSLAPNELMVDRETLENEFLNLVEAEGVSDVEELDRVLEKAVTLKNMLKNRERIDKIAKFVANHFKTVIEPMGYKAFLVAVDREACAFYKEALDRYLPPEYSAVVISKNYNDPPELAKYHLAEEKEEQIRKAFRSPDSLPNILIVTEKLLTGYDAPILYCMYLDKPMRDHVLLQAIARVNRPYEDDEGRRKRAGFILDFVGIFGNLEKALAFDSEDVQSVVEGVDVLKERFESLMAEGREKYLPLVKDKVADKAAEAVLEYFRDKERRHEFYQYFKELQDIYEILSPDPFLRPFMSDYEELARMYRMLRANYEPGISIDREFLRKTARLVQEHTDAVFSGETTKFYKLDEETLEKVLNDNKPDTVKVFNLLKAIRVLVEQESQRSPYLIPIGERAEQIAKAFEERQLTTKETLKQLELLLRDGIEGKKAEAQSDLSPEGFAVFWLLKREGVAKAEKAAQQIENAFKQFPHWERSSEQERGLRIALFKVLLDVGAEQVAESVEQVAELAERIMKMLRRRSA